MARAAEAEKPTRFSDYIFVRVPAENRDIDGCAEDAQVVLKNGVLEREGMLVQIRRWLSQNVLLCATVVGVLFGLIVGFGLRPTEPSNDTILLISYPGELYMRLLKLLILPLIISSLIAGSASLNAKLNGKIALRTLCIFFATSVFNAFLGIVLALAFHPGNSGLKGQNEAGASGKAGISVLDSLLDLGRNLIADNIFQATFQQAYTEYVNVTLKTYIKANDSYGIVHEIAKEVRYRLGINTIGIVFFCLIFGTILGTIGPRAKVLIEFFVVIFEVIMKMVNIIIWVTPVGVCSLIAGKILSVADVALVMTQLATFIATCIVGVFVYQLIVLQLMYFIFIRRNPFKFYLGLMEGILASFATASKAAALPVTFNLMDNKVKVDPRISRFVLPIGCNINMDGTALFIAIAAIFIAQMNGIELGVGKLVTVWFTATMASFSVASVPSAALVLLLMVLSSIETPVEDVSLLFAVDWLVDRFRTTNNMLGDCYTAAIVERLSRKELGACDAATYGQGNGKCDSQTDKDTRGSVELTDVDIQ